MHKLLALIFSLFLTSGCAPTAEHEAQGVDLNVERASLMDADRAMFEAYSTGDGGCAHVSLHRRRECSRARHAHGPG
jgi:hypothetical protein